MSMDEQTTEGVLSYLGERVAQLGGGMTVYADIPGIWKMDGTLFTSDGITAYHTRLIPISGYNKIFGRTWMDYGSTEPGNCAVAYFDEAFQFMAAISVPGGATSAESNIRFGNNGDSEPLSVPTGAFYVSISGWGTTTDYPFVFSCTPGASPNPTGYDFGFNTIGRMEQRGVSYADFGAKMDGVHDDTDAVIACHNYANEHHCPVFQHSGTIYMSTAQHRHNAQIKTDVDWTGTTFIIEPPISDEKIVFAVAPDNEETDVTLTGTQIAQLHSNWLNIPFLRDDYPNRLVTFRTDIMIGKRDGEPDYTEPSYYSETAAVDRNGGLMDGPLFLDMTGAGSVTMVRRSLLDNPITIKGGTFLRGTGERFVNPYYLYISRSNVTIEGMKSDVGARIEEGNLAYRGEYIRADYAYNLCFRDCVFENFGNFLSAQDAAQDKSQTSYVLVCTHCENILIDHCEFLRGWGPIQTSWCKRLTVRDSTMGRIDNHYGCRDYLIEGCTMVTSHSNINVGYGDGYLTVRDTKFIKTRDYDTMHQSRIIYCREDMCAIFSGTITLENIQIETNYVTTVLYAAMERDFQYKAASTDRILPLKLPKVRMKNIYFKHYSDLPVTLTIAEYGVRAEASALTYGNVQPDDMIIDGIWSDQDARLLPMLEHVSGTQSRKWMIKAVNYNCALAIEKDASIDPTEDLDADIPLIMMVRDLEADFLWLFGNAQQPIYVWKRIQ